MLIQVLPKCLHKFLLARYCSLIPVEYGQFQKQGDTKCLSIQQTSHSYNREVPKVRRTQRIKNYKIYSSHSLIFTASLSFSSLNLSISLLHFVGFYFSVPIVFSTSSRNSQDLTTWDKVLMSSNIGLSSSRCFTYFRTMS